MSLVQSLAFTLPRLSRLALAPRAFVALLLHSYIAQDLGRLAIKGLLTKTALDPAKVDYTLYGTVIQEGGYIDHCDTVMGRFSSL